ncbi:MAG: hypothetical protein ACO4BU_12550, partial [Phycisphaerales bacterium]
GLATELVISRAEFTSWFCREVAHRFDRPMKGAEVPSRESPFKPGTWRDTILGEFMRELRAGIELPPEAEPKPRRRRRRRSQGEDSAAG